MKELHLNIEELEERIAPAFIFVDGTPPSDAGAGPGGPFGPDTALIPQIGNDNPWNGARNAPVLGIAPAP